MPLDRYPEEPHPDFVPFLEKIVQKLQDKTISHKSKELLRHTAGFLQLGYAHTLYPIGSDVADADLQIVVETIGLEPINTTDTQWADVQHMLHTHTRISRDTLQRVWGNPALPDHVLAELRRPEQTIEGMWFNLQAKNKPA